VAGVTALFGGAGALDAPAAIGGGGFGGIGTPPELIGHGLDEQGAHEVLDRCVELGVVIVDTAHSYAGGASHRMIGSWLAADASRAERIAIVDKVGMVARDGQMGIDLSAGRVVAQADEGRRRLGVAAVDVIMTHAPDPATPPVDTATALATLLDRGSARHWGLSNITNGDLVAWLDTVDRIGLPDPLFVENRYSLVDRDDEAEVLPSCRERGITYLAFSPLAGGVLTGKYRRDQVPPPGSRMTLRPEFGARLDHRLHAALDALTAMASDRGVSPAALALAWVLAQPGVRPVVGVSKPHHLDALAAALDMELEPADVEAIAGSMM
jgi:aryl-alcohol dehydrogenase-like predicted oxidoreductase